MENSSLRFPGEVFFILNIFLLIKNTCHPRNRKNAGRVYRTLETARVYQASCIGFFSPLPNRTKTGKFFFAN